ncbi:MAG: tRNA pseudouridine(55) synthase TruB [Pseudomonadota bacterium]
MLAVDKPEGLSSARVVARVKHGLGARKVGHTGTLDPFATGLLLLGINSGTRISRFILGGNKTYLARLHLGVETDTQDLTGEVVSRSEPGMVESLDTESIIRVARAMTGPQKQQPPVFSALKHEGQPLYRLARQGKPVEKPARDIEIFSIHVSAVSLPFVDFSVRCSAGTYIRTLARDMGRHLGCGGHLCSLRRVETCGFTVDDALTLSDLGGMSPGDIEARVIPMAQVLEPMPAYRADSELTRIIRFGQPIPDNVLAMEPLVSRVPHVRVLDSAGELLAVLEYVSPGDSYIYCCVFND